MEGRRRPRKEDRRRHVKTLRLNDEEQYFLSYIFRKEGTNEADALRKSVTFLYKLNKNDVQFV